MIKSRTRCALYEAQCIQALELRLLFSAGLNEHGVAIATGAGVAKPVCVALDSSAGAPLASSGPVGYTPADIQQAYGINQINFGGVTGDGSGQTVAIVETYDDPNIIPDLATFDSAFGLPDTTTSQVNSILTKVNQTGGSSLPPAAPTGGSSWSLEESLDVEWVHAVAPAAKILVVECSSSNFGYLVGVGVNYAKSVAGVSVVSMSFGFSEWSNELYGDSDFSGSSGITYVASTGDSGAPAEYPALSPNVLGVGGTTLSIDASGDYLGESAWSGGGGGPSVYEPQPSYQNKVTLGNGYRTAPDISFDASPSSGAAVCDSYDFGSTPWVQVGGTSMAAPCVSGLIAIANQGRVLSGLGTLNGATQTLPALYGLPAADFNDITTGSNGYSAGPGYDLATGLGSPIANLLVPALAKYGAATSTSTAVTSSSSSSSYGQAVTFTATVTATSGSGETGTVQFQIDGSNVGSAVSISGSTATFTTSTLAVGSHLVVAIYSGDSKFAGSTSATFSQSVGKAATTAVVTSSSASSIYGQSVTLMATVTPATGSGETGTIQFELDGSNVGGAVSISYNIATITLSSIGAGSNSIVAIYNGDGNFNASTSSSFTQTISTASLTITADADIKTYGQTKTYGAGSTAFFSSGLQNGETIGSVTLTASGGAAANAGVGTYTLSPSVATGGTFNASDYSITYSTGTLTVNAASLTITANADTKTYGQTKSYGAGSTAFFSSALQNGETIGSVTLTASGGTAPNAGVGTYTLTPSAAAGGTFNAGNYSITYNTGSLTVNAALLSIAANNDSKTYGQTKIYGAGSTAFFTSGLQNSETIGSVTLSASGGALASAGVGTYTLTPSAATGGTFNAGNYSITYNAGTLTVNTALLSITANAASKVYGQTKTYGAGSTAFFSSGLQNSETIGSVTLTASGGTAANASVGTYTLAPSAATGGTFNVSDYSIIYNSGTLTVNAAPLSITANSDSKTYGQTKTYGPGSTAFLSSGLQNNETIGTVTLTASGGAAANASAGTYSLTPSAAAGGTFNASDYSITYNAGTLTVNRLALTVTATGVNKLYDGGITAVVTLSDNRLAGDVLSDSYSSAVFADPNAGVGKTVSVSGISISGPEAGDYLLQNTTAGTTANITPSATTTLVTSSSTSPTYGQSITFTATVTPASGSGETGSVQFQIDGSNVGGAMNLSGGTATYTTSALAVGNHSVIAIYSGDGNFNTSTSSAYTQTVSTASLTISANSDSKTYGQGKAYGAGSTAFFSNGLKNGETIGSVTLTASGGTASNASVGSYALIPSAATGGTFNASDYSITYNAGTLTVNKLALTVTATGESKIYDGSAGATATLQDNRLSGDLLIDSYSVAVFSDPHPGTDKTVTVSGISISGPDAADYALQNTTASTTANISQSTTTTAVASSNTSPTYGQSITFTATVTPASGSGETGSVQFLVDGGNVGSAVNISGGTATYTTSTLSVGTHSVQAIYSGDGNFNSSASSTFTQTVSTASLSITANSDSKTYGQTKTYGPGSTAFLSSGLQNSETIGTVTLTASGGAAANASAGTYSLTPSAAAGGTFNASDYSITYNAGTLTVNRLALTVTATGVNKVYDGGITAVVTLSDNRLAGDVLSDGYSSAVFADPNAGVGKTVSVSGISISGPEAGDYLLQNTTASTTANITPSATTTLVTSSSTSPTYGQSITFTATVTPASGSGETGSVQFQIDGSNVGGAMNLSGGTATYTTSALAVGNHSVIAIYSGDGNFNTSTSSAYTQTVTAPPSPLNLIGSAYLELDATTPGQLDVWTGTTNTGTPTDTYPLSQVSSITDSGGGGNVTLTVNFSNGNPLGSVTPGVTFDNTNHTDALVIVGDNHGDTYNATSGQVIVSGGAQPAFNAVSISFDSTISESIQAGTGPDVLAVNGSTTLTYTAPTGGSNPTAQLSSLSIGSGSRVLFTSPGTSRALLELSSAANWAGQLDLQSNDLLIHGGASAFGVVNNLLTSGFNKGTWTGQGITSSSAASEGSHLAALGTILNDQNGTAVFTSNNLFDGVAPAATDVLVKYTYLGDTDLDGEVTGSDYSKIDNGYLNQLSGWSNGDFNYDGVINGSDYTLIDNSYNNQGASLAGLLAPLAASADAELATPRNMGTNRRLAAEQSTSGLGIGIDSSGSYPVRAENDFFDRSNFIRATRTARPVQGDNHGLALAALAKPAHAVRRIRTNLTVFSKVPVLVDEFRLF